MKRVAITDSNNRGVILDFQVKEKKYTFIKWISKKFLKKEKQLYDELYPVSNKFDNLAPLVLEGEDRYRISPYLDGLRAGLIDEDVKNIAIMGPYGAGKTSIIKRFQSENPQYNYFNLDRLH